MANKFLEKLKLATIERQVEDIYNEMLKTEFHGINLSYPCNCDGYFEFDVNETKKLRCICEFKQDLNLSKKSERSKVLAQVIFYLKKFETEGLPLPNIALIGDKNECFFIHTNHLVKWLDLDGIDWSIAPSHAATQTVLFEALITDENNGAIVFDVNEDFDFSVIASQIKDQVTEVQRFVHITEQNIGKIFRLFCDKVLKSAKSIQPNELVAVFYKSICDHENCYIHPAKKNILVSGAKEYRIDGGTWKAFTRLFGYVESPVQKAKLAAIADRLIEDVTRRRQGAFFTPTEWTTEAHRRITEFLGPNWRDEYVVVDPAAGTKNLERDYRFSELYLSTLESSELEISKHYCQEAKATAVLDFLNSTDEEMFKALPGLEDALKANRKIVWLMNPPYLRANKKDHTDVVINFINKQMNIEKFGKCSANLYTQFLYRIILLKKKYNATNFVLAFFCNPGYITASDFKKFREVFLKEFKFENGMLFNAGHFADTASIWGINFSIWSSGETIDKNTFIHDLMDVDDNGDIIKVGEKNIYNIDGKQLMSNWLREAMTNIKKVKALPLTNAISVKTDGRVYMELLSENALGFFFSKANDVQHNSKESSMFSSVLASGMGGGINILPDNFSRCCSAFAARRLIKGDWINNKDEYTVPDETNSKYKKFAVDSLVFSVFDNNSHQSSLRDIEYKNQKWNIKNQFCWYSKETAMKLADENGLDVVYHDARTSDEPYMVKVLNDNKEFMSDEAKAVLEKANELVVKSFKYRNLFAEDHPEYQTDKAWDIGYYQLKAIWKEYMAEDFKVFRELVKNLADKMRPMVYELGFLRK